MSAHRIMVVEDDGDIADVLEYNLKAEGYEVECFERGDKALAALRSDPPDLLLLDLMLPGIEGLDVARLLKQDPATATIPIIILTARDEEVDRIVGLELGADDYLTKPFSVREVTLRVKAVLRRTRAGQDGRPVAVGRLRIDGDAHRVFVDDREIQLTATEFRLLETLAQRPGHVRTREQLLSEVWDYAPDVETRTVDTYVRRLRQKLGPQGDAIQTLIGVGYRLDPDDG